MGQKYTFLVLLFTISVYFLQNYIISMSQARKRKEYYSNRFFDRALRSSSSTARLKQSRQSGSYSSFSPSMT